jgi:maltooligosyltrehalose trehalohydrolase
VQNHDEVGNRCRGERLAALVCFERQKLAAATLLLSPFVPLLFMGEEYGETRPFHYFVSHSDPGLIESVRRGRRAEWRPFGRGICGPGREETFLRSRPAEVDTPERKALLALYRD